MAKQGDTQALDALLGDANLKHYVRRIAAKKQIRAEQFDDLYQRVLLKISRAIRNWQGTTHIRNYVYRITANCCYDMLRQRPQQFEFTNSIDETHLSYPASQYTQAERGEQEARMRAWLQEMGEPCERMMTLYLFDDWDRQEIRRHFSWQKTTFYTRFKRCALLLLQKITKSSQNSGNK